MIDLNDSIEELAQRQIHHTKTALWIYDFDIMRVIWANKSALDIWDAESLEELKSRNLEADMSETVKCRLQQYKKDLSDLQHSIFEVWTLYPGGQPKNLDITYRGVYLPDSRIAMLCEGVESNEREPDSVRSAEALLHTPVMISLIKKSGQIIYENPSARNCFGDSNNIDNRFDIQDDINELLENLLVSEQARKIVRVSTVSGKKWHDITFQKRLDAVNGEEVFLISEIDVTKLKEAEERAEKADRAKSQFLANVSHEIRTPLNGVIGVVDLLSETKLNYEQMQYVNMVATSGKSLLTIINDLLDYSKLQAERMTIHSAPFDLNDILDYVASLTSPKAEEKGIEFIVRINPNMPSKLIGDQFRLQQVILNLVNNAVKFTEKGLVELILDGYQLNSNEWSLQVTVSDTGCGIPEEQLDYVFEKFFQSDGSTTRAHEGTGLGLSICDSLVRLMGSEICVESTLGVGTNFSFEIKTKMHTHQPLIQKGALQCEDHFVILVGLDYAHEKIYREIFERTGVKFESCKSIDIAIKAISRLPVSAAQNKWILLDSDTIEGMPKRGSAKYDLSSALRGTKVILQSPIGYSHRNIGQALSIFARVTKPVLPRNLLNTFHKNSDCRELSDLGGDLLSDSSPSLVEGEPSVKFSASENGNFCCRDRPLILICDDNHANRFLMERALRKVDCDFLIAKNGADAVEIHSLYRPDIIMMDISMPVMDGIVATSLIREAEAKTGFHTTIIACTAHVGDSQRSRLLSSGMDDYIFKPYRPKYIAEVVEKWLRTGSIFSHVGA